MHENLVNDAFDESTTVAQGGPAVENITVPPLDGEMASRLRKAIFFRSACSKLRSALKAGAVIMLGVTALGFVIAAQLESGGLDPHFWIPLLVSESILFFAGWAANVWMGKLIRKYNLSMVGCISRLARLSDTEDLRTLLLFRNIDHPALLNTLMDRLTTITNGIQPGEDRCLSGSEWRRSLERIEADWWVESSSFGVAIIRMFERTHDPCAIDVVRRYARPASVMIASEAVRRAARESLPVLEAAFLKQKERETLLRASGPSSAQEHELLRAASSANSSQSELLLRPSSTDSSTL